MAITVSKPLKGPACYEIFFQKHLSFALGKVNVFLSNTTSCLCKSMSVLLAPPELWPELVFGKRWSQVDIKGFLG